MHLLPSSRDYLFNLHAFSSSEAKKLWRRHIKEKWEDKCAYCGSRENITLDHIVPRARGGLDTSHNVVACCKSCNQSKGIYDWKEWFEQQEFFTEHKLHKLVHWIDTQKNEKLKLHGIL